MKEIAGKIEKVIDHVNKIEGDLPNDAKGDAILDALQESIRALRGAKMRCSMPITYYENPIAPVVSEKTPPKKPKE